MFYHFNNKIVNLDTISYINTRLYVTDQIITIYYKNDKQEIVKGVEALNIIMLLCPSVLEGKGAKYIKNWWAIHNLIGHPLMQILCWLRLYEWGIKIHEKTVPKPVLK